jgi:O-antigen/teichoic acid export membrane protein
MTSSQRAEPSSTLFRVLRVQARKAGRVVGATLLALALALVASLPWLGTARMSPIATVLVIVLPAALYSWLLRPTPRRAPVAAERRDREAHAVLADSHVLTSERLLARNVGLNLAGWILPAVLALVAIPVLVRALGASRFGILSLVWALLGYIAFLDLGIGRALTQLLADRLGRGAHDDLTSLTWTAFWLPLPLGIGAGVVVAAIAPWLAGSVLDVPADLREESVRAFRVLSVAVPFIVSTAVFRGILEATQRFGWVNALRVPLALLTFLGPLAVLPFSPTLPAVVSVFVAAHVVVCVGYYAGCRRVFGPMRRVTPPSRKHVRSLLSIGSWMTVSAVVSPMMYSLDRFVVAALLSVMAVAHYAIAYEAVTRLWIVTGVVLPVIFPALALALGRDPERANALFAVALRVTAAIGFPATLLASAFADEWLTVWAGPDVAHSAAPLAQVLAAGVFVNMVAQISYTVVQAAGRADLPAKYHLFELGLYAVLLWVLVRPFGTLGAAAAWSIRAMFDALLLFGAASRVMPGARGVALRSARWAVAGSAAILVPLFLPDVLFRAAYVAVWFVVLLANSTRTLVRSEQRAVFAWFFRARFLRRPVSTGPIEAL